MALISSYNRNRSISDDDLFLGVDENSNTSLFSVGDIRTYLANTLRSPVITSSNPTSYSINVTVRGAASKGQAGILFSDQTRNLKAAAVNNQADLISDPNLNVSNIISSLDIDFSAVTWDASTFGEVRTSPDVHVLKLKTNTWSAAGLANTSSLNSQTIWVYDSGDRTIKAKLTRVNFGRDTSANPYFTFTDASASWTAASDIQARVFITGRASATGNNYYQNLNFKKAAATTNIIPVVQGSISIRNQIGLTGLFVIFYKNGIEMSLSTVDPSTITGNTGFSVSSTQKLFKTLINDSGCPACFFSAARNYYGNSFEQIKGIFLSTTRFVLTVLAPTSRIRTINTEEDQTDNMHYPTSMSGELFNHSTHPVLTFLIYDKNSGTGIWELTKHDSLSLEKIKLSDGSKTYEGVCLIYDVIKISSSRFSILFDYNLYYNVTPRSGATVSDQNILGSITNSHIKQNEDSFGMFPSFNFYTNSSGNYTNLRSITGQQQQRSVPISSKAMMILNINNDNSLIPELSNETIGYVKNYFTLDSLSSGSIDLLQQTDTVFTFIGHDATLSRSQGLRKYDITTLSYRSSSFKVNTVNRSSISRGNTNSLLPQNSLYVTTYLNGNNIYFHTFTARSGYQIWYNVFKSDKRNYWFRNSLNYTSTLLLGRYPDATFNQNQIKSIAYNTSGTFNFSGTTTQISTLVNRFYNYMFNSGSSGNFGTLINTIPGSVREVILSYTKQTDELAGRFYFMNFNVGTQFQPRTYTTYFRPFIFKDQINFMYGFTSGIDSYYNMANTRFGSYTPAPTQTYLVPDFIPIKRLIIRNFDTESNLTIHRLLSNMDGFFSEDVVDGATTRFILSGPSGAFNLWDNLQIGTSYGINAANGMLFAGGSFGYAITNQILVKYLR